MGDTTDELLALAAQVSKLPDARELDLLLSTGEQVSAALLVMALQERGVNAVSLTGPQAGITTDGLYGRARITGVSPERIQRELDAGRIAVVAGFQGSNQTEIATLGRGGSDTSAVALAIAMGAARCEIYTDVDGVYSADPTGGAGRAAAARDRLRGDARAGAPGREGDANSFGRAGVGARHGDRRAQDGQ